MRKCAKSEESVPKLDKVWQTVPEFEKVWESVLKPGKVLESVPKLGKVWETEPEVEKVRESVLKVQKVWENVLKVQKVWGNMLKVKKVSQNWFEHLTYVHERRKKPFLNAKQKMKIKRENVVQNITIEIGFKMKCSLHSVTELFRNSRKRKVRKKPSNAGP